VQAQKGFMLRNEELLREALARAAICGSPLTHAFATDRYGAYLGMSGRWDEALAQFSRSIAIYAAQGVRYQQAMNINYGGRCYSARAGRLADSLRYAAQFREMAGELGDAPLLAWRAMEAEPYIYQGAWDDVMRVADESLPIAWQIGEITVILFVSAWLGLAYLKVGRLTEARRVIDRAAEHGQASRDATPFALTYITIAAALARLAAGEADAALETARRALGFADRSRFRLEQGAAHRVLGQAYAATGHRAEADAAFRHSLEILEAIRSWPELGQTLLAYGQFQLGTLGTDPAQGHAFIERARAIFDEIGAPGWLAEAEAALGAR
jgi:tetratricopeptide (TPR) repeat protein